MLAMTTPSWARARRARRMAGPWARRAAGSGPRLGV